MEITHITKAPPPPKAPEPSKKLAVKPMEILKDSKKIGKDIAQKAEKEKDKKLENIAEAIRAANTAIEPVNKRIKFMEYPGTNRKMIQVVDSETNEVIFEVPPAEVLNLAARIKAVVGIIFDRNS